MAIRQRALTLSGLLLGGLLLLLVFAHTPGQAQTSQRCFAETDLCIEGRIREFWEQNGGLAVFGLPLTTQFAADVDGQTREVQWFERARLELHPEQPRPYDVLLGRLGADTLERQGRIWETFPRGLPQDDCLSFAETGHTICEPFLTTWQANGLETDGQPGISQQDSLALFGLPLSEPQPEALADGQTYTVQWFERARFELHPQNDPPNTVLLGLLGVELLSEPSTAPSPEPMPTPDLSPVTDARRIAFVSDRDGDNDVYLVNADGSGLTKLTTSSSANDTQPTWSPDGTQIAFVSDRDGNNDVYVINIDGSGLYNLTRSDADNFHPDWSPDGTRIAFASTRRGKTDVYVINTFGAGLTNLTSAFAISESPTWSPDGTQIAFSANRDGGDWEIYVMDRDGRNQTNITDTPEDDRDPVWSPDGTRIAYVSNRAGDWEVYAMRADGNEQRNLSNNSDDDGFPSWSPTGADIVFHTLSFAAFESPNYELIVMSNDGRTQRNLSDHPANDRLPEWSPVMP